MKKILSLIVMVVSVLIQTNAQGTLSAVKVFEPDTIGIGGLSDMYIVSVGAKEEGAWFCFYTMKDSIWKILRTDIEGRVIDLTDKPAYTYTVYNGDTLYIDPHGIMVNAASGDTITNGVGVTVGIAASPSGIYVFRFYPGKRTIPYYVTEILNHNTLWRFENTGTINVNGFCYGEGVVYILMGKAKLTYMNEDGSNRREVIVPVEDARGMGVFGGSLYVYSQTDNAVYRLDPPEVVTSVSSNRAGVEQTAYYNLLGEKTDAPSGLTIVVTRYNDGSIRTEKKLFR